MNSKVSVIVPVFNRENLIERTLNSILCQTIPPDELIVVDNNSTDKSYKVVESWMNRNSHSGIKFQLLKQETIGAAPTRQKGLENAGNDYVIFFDSDDEMLPSLIEKTRGKLNSNPDIDIICWKCGIRQLNGSYRIPPFDPANPLENHLIHTLLRPQGYMVKKTFLENVGGWTKDIKVWNDFELGLRLLINHPKLGSINEILAEIHAQEESITGINFSHKEGEWEKTLDEMHRVIMGSQHFAKEKIIRILDYRRSVLAAHYYLEGNKTGAKRLLQDTFKSKSLWDVFLLKFAYHYTKKGLRGAYRLLRPFYS